MAVPITTDTLAQDVNADLMPCPKDWNRKAGRGPVCRPIAEEEDIGDSLMPCPKNWDPHAGRGPTCRPNIKSDNIEVGGINNAVEDDKGLMPCPKKWDPRFGKGPASRPLDGSP
ncbi:hypothetical protein BGZ68_001339 [Mortierella alpina]|nr:hypothetical protein BGZ68_001339 [Mortierella alpina]